MVVTHRIAKLAAGYGLLEARRACTLRGVEILITEKGFSRERTINRLHLEWATGFWHDGFTSIHSRTASWCVWVLGTLESCIMF